MTIQCSDLGELVERLKLGQPESKPESNKEDAPVKTDDDVTAFLRSELDKVMHIISTTKTEFKTQYASNDGSLAASRLTQLI